MIFNIIEKIGDTHIAFNDKFRAQATVLYLGEEAFSLLKAAATARWKADGLAAIEDKNFMGLKIFVVKDDPEHVRVA